MNLTPDDCLSQLTILTDAIKNNTISSIAALHPINKFLTADPACEKIKTNVLILSGLTEPVLITGDSGTGKEIIARALHGYADSRPFIAVNCASLPDTLASSILQGYERGAFTGAAESKPGIFELARNGTVFLDEIGDMPASQQSILLRIIQENEVLPIGSGTVKPIKCRIIAATNKDPTVVLREDLYGRLMAFEIKIPPFSSRFNDALLIAESLGLPNEIATSILLDIEKLNLYGVRYLQALGARYKVGLL